MLTLGSCPSGFFSSGFLLVAMTEAGTGGVVLGVTDADTGGESLLEVLFPCLLGLILGLTISLRFSTDILERSFVDVLPNSVMPKVDAPAPTNTKVVHYSTYSGTFMSYLITL